MADIVLRDIDPVLAERIRQVSVAHGWSLPETLQKLLEQGLHAREQGAMGSFDAGEEGVLQAAIMALEQVPDDPGFSLIGRVSDAPAPADEGPDQTVTGFVFE